MGPRARPPGNTPVRPVACPHRVYPAAFPGRQVTVARWHDGLFTSQPGPSSPSGRLAISRATQVAPSVAFRSGTGRRSAQVDISPARPRAGSEPSRRTGPYIAGFRNSGFIPATLQAKCGSCRQDSRNGAPREVPPSRRLAGRFPKPRSMRDLSRVPNRSACARTRACPRLRV